ncbi:hypothetical protein ABEB36_015597 [Hypothenemus hampei]|uniref:Uncharacterized protein n=1 Tax=Hypothenemus hampei TaxID=57062 RepID=A0ABD1DZE3_HYPHA
MIDLKKERLSQSTPSSPRLLPRRVRESASTSARGSATCSVPRVETLEVCDREPNDDSSSEDINWKERCLKLQMELHRNRAQATRTRDMLREKVSLAFSFSHDMKNIQHLLVFPNSK